MIVLSLTMLFLSLPVEYVLAAGETLDLSVAVDSIWVLAATTLVFIMHAGFAMVETGFTRAKNALGAICALSEQR